MVLFFIAIINAQIVSELPDEFLDPMDIAEYNRQLNEQISNDDQFMTIVLNLTVNKSGRKPQFSSMLDNIFKKTFESIAAFF